MAVSGDAQDKAHPQGFDYVEGSPHLKHPELRRMVESSLSRLVQERIQAGGRCDVLEVGAGHGDFTDLLVAGGARVTVTEMSSASVERLKARFPGDDRVTVIHDPQATWIDETNDTFDVVACISVLHHIPDYLAFVDKATRLIREGGSFVSWQDPTWYPRRSAATAWAERAAYFSWRVGQGELRRGLRTRWRRVQGKLDETLAEDMSEYHVVRSGVDDTALAQLARARFESVAMQYYWSTQSTIGQRIGSRWDPKNTFGLEATGRIPES